VAVIEPGQMNTPFKDNRHKAAVFQQGKSAYQKALTHILEYGNRQSARAPGPLEVSRTILGALGDKRMALRYPVGTDAKWYPFLRRFIPDGLFDLILRGMYSRFER
jgi:NAD(P)-dependent dehydrogenase (short-subunit alcohol dehydrogenase family)